MVAASAYRSGSRLYDELRQEVANYLRRTRGVVQTVILSPAGAPEWANDPGQLWNSVERSEKRKDAQLAREFIVAMPVELDAKQQWELAVGWAQSELVEKGMVAVRISPRSFTHLPYVFTNSRYCASTQTIPSKK